MKYPVYPWTTPESMPKDAESIQLVRPISAKKLVEIVERLNLKQIFLSNSCAKRLSIRARKFLQDKNIELKHFERRVRAIHEALTNLIK